MKYVLDSSAVIALLNREPTNIDLRSIIPGGIVSTVNLAEIVDRYARDGNDRNSIEAVLDALQLQLMESGYSARI